MGDVFKEQIVKRKDPPTNFLKRAGLIVAVIAIFFILGYTPLGGLAAPITLGAAFGAFYLMGFLRVEYEYVFTNGELDIDIIYNRSRRKRLFTASVKSFEIMAHVEDAVHAGSFNSAVETRDYSSGEVGPDTYAFLVSVNGKQTKIIIEPNERMMQAIAGSMSRSKLHRK